MKFILTTDQNKKFQEWSKKFTSYSGAIGGAFTFSFTPTNLGTTITVVHFQGEKLDLTDYDEF